LHAKLKRYEQLLESHGLELDVINGSASDRQTVSEAEVEMVEDPESSTKAPAPAVQFEKTKPGLVSQDGSSIYFEG
jgi:hypothetical protein